MAEHNPQYLIELDGNKSPEDHFVVSMGHSTASCSWTIPKSSRAVLVLCEEFYSEFRTVNLFVLTL